MAKKALLGFLVFSFLVSSQGFAQVELKGEISGITVDEGGQALPGVSISLTGNKLFQKSLSTNSNEKGIFRFLNLNPGTYEMEFSFQGFNSKKIIDSIVHAGRTTPVRVVLSQTRLAEQVDVVASAPLIETKRAQIATNFTSVTLSSLPSERNLFNVVDFVPGINDRNAYGAGGKFEEEGRYYSQGSVTSAYRVNGVDISNPDWGNTWVQPNFDTIEEIEIVGIGASAEYGNFMGATINVITKSGANRFSGGLGTYYSSDKFRGDNSQGNIDLTPTTIGYESESSIYLGGPIIKEKLFFFLAGGYTTVKSKEDPLLSYSRLKQPHFQAKLDYLLNKSNTLTFMINTDPLDDTNVGLYLGASPDIAYDRVFRATALYGEWQSRFKDTTVFSAKYAGFFGKDKMDPITLGVPGIYTNSGLVGAHPIIRSWSRDRHEVNANITHYADRLLGMSHELKLGFGFEKASVDNNQVLNGDAMLFAFQINPYIALLQGITNYEDKSKAYVQQFSGFFQDNIQISRNAMANLGLRFDSPRLTARGVSGTLTKYTTLSPRLGFTYDFDGQARNVGHLSFGRYHNKLATFGISLGVPGSGHSDTYSMLYFGEYVVDLSKIDELKSLIFQPENYLYTSGGSEPIPFNPGFHSPYTDVFNVGFEKQIFSQFALSIDYIYKRDRAMMMKDSRTLHEYTEVEWTDPWLGNTITLWDQVDRNPEEWYFTNSTWAKRRHHFLILTLKKKQIGKWYFLASFTYQNSKGNVSNSYNSALGSQYFSQHDPLYVNNPYQWGPLDRPFQFKLATSYIFPLGISGALDLRILSGAPWAPTADLEFADIYREGTYDIRLEPRGSRKTPTQTTINIRIEKIFRISNRYNLSIYADIFNPFNSHIVTGLGSDPTRVYPISGESSFNMPTALIAPVNARFGFRFSF